MTFAPVVSGAGIAGWQFLSRTLDSQLEAHSSSPLVSREVASFRERIASVATASSLVADRDVLKVVLGAYGLQDDLDNRYFIRKILEDGATDPSALANKLSDPRYRALASDFDFSGGAPQTLQSSSFVDEIVGRFKRQDFEISVGAQSTSLRLALGLEREIETLAERVSGADAQWFSVMGTAPLRRVFEVSLRLPKEIATLDIERQLKIFKERSQAVFDVSKPSDFQDPELVEVLRQRFLASSQDTVRPISPSVVLLADSGSANGILSTLYA